MHTQGWGRMGSCATPPTPHWVARSGGSTRESASSRWGRRCVHSCTHQSPWLYCLGCTRSSMHTGSRMPVTRRACATMPKHQHAQPPTPACPSMQPHHHTHVRTHTQTHTHTHTHTHTPPPRAQCYDTRMLSVLKACAEQVVQSSWGMGGPHDAGKYSEWPHQTGFFQNSGSWTSVYGRFFLQVRAGLCVVCVWVCGCVWVCWGGEVRGAGHRG